MPSGSGGYDQLRAAYDAGKTDDALQLLLKDPAPGSAAYFFDLGTVSYRLGKVGLAVAYLEKAARLKFRDADTLHNLGLARTALGRLIGNERLDAVSGPLDSASDLLSATEVRATLALVALLLLVSGAVTYLRSGSSFKGWVRTTPGLLALIGTLLAGVAGVSQSLPGSLPPAMALERQTVRSGPGDRFLELSQLETGMKLRLLGPTAKDAGQEGTSWLQVRYSGDGVGWVKATGLLSL